MTEDYIADLHKILLEMSDEELLDLDPVCEALQVYQKKYAPKRGRVLPNRVAALAAIDQMWAWEDTIWNRE